jgi:hypothetical protein
VKTGLLQRVFNGHHHAVLTPDHSELKPLATNYLIQKSMSVEEARPDPIPLRGSLPAENFRKLDRISPLLVRAGGLSGKIAAHSFSRWKPSSDERKRK